MVIFKKKYIYTKWYFSKIFKVKKFDPNILQKRTILKTFSGWHAPEPP